MGIVSARLWLLRTVVGLGINRFLSDFGHEAGTALLPLFLVASGVPPFALGAIAADMVPEHVRSTGFGVLATVNGIGGFVSSLVVGLLWTAFSPAVGFVYSFILSLVGAVTMAVALRSPNTDTQQRE